VLLAFYLFWRIIIRTIRRIFEVRKARRKNHKEDEDEDYGGDEEAL